MSNYDNISPFYDNPSIWDVESYWDGVDVTPSPQQTGNIVTIRRPKTPKKTYCRLDIDAFACSVNGNHIQLNAMPIRHESEEDEGSANKFAINQVKLRKDISQNLNFTVESTKIDKPTIQLTAKPINRLEIEPEFVVEHFRINRSPVEPIITSRIISKKCQT